MTTYRQQPVLPGMKPDSLTQVRRWKWKRWPGISHWYASTPDGRHVTVYLGTTRKARCTNVQCKALREAGSEELCAHIKHAEALEKRRVGKKQAIRANWGAATVRHQNRPGDLTPHVCVDCHRVIEGAAVVRMVHGTRQYACAARCTPTGHGWHESTGEERPVAVTA